MQTVGVYNRYWREIYFLDKEMGFENESCVSSLGCGGLPGYLESRFEMQTVR